MTDAPLPGIPKAATTVRLTSLIALALSAMPAPAAHALDLVGVWRAASTHDAAFSAARAAHAAGAARRTQAGTLWRPTVNLDAGVAVASNETATRGAQFSAPGFGQTTGVAFDTSVTNGASSRVALALRQPLLSGEREARQRQLEISADAADLEWHSAQQALILRSAERYFDAALAAERLRLLVRQQAAVDRALVEAQDRFRLGDRPVTDTYEAGARAASLKAQRLEAETELELKRAALADLTGLALEGSTLSLPGAASGDVDPGRLDDALAQAAQHNPALAMAESGLHGAEQEARKTRAALSPSLDLVAQIGRERLAGSGDFGTASNSTRNSAIGLQLTVPLYTGGWRSARQSESQALVDEASAQVEQARRQAALQTRAAWLDLAVGSGRVAALEAGARASASRLDATRVGREAGDRTTLDLLNAENDAAAAELALTQARVQLLTSRLRLAALTGELDERRLQQVNAALQPGR